jgi:hypothetical protein
MNRAAIAEQNQSAATNAAPKAVETAAGNAREEIASLKMRQEQLLVLVGELLQTNEELRQKLARLETTAH